MKVNVINKIKTGVRWETVCIAIIMVMAACLRLIGLSAYPDGTYTDEAYGAYNAWGMLTEGIDDRGYSFPVYFVAWGSGMSALYLYLGMFMFKLFGVSILAYRIPQAFFGIVSILALYYICKELFNQRFALLAALALTVTPWHIMMCRFGLDANLAPSFFLLSLLFLVWGLQKKEIYLIPAAVLFGLTLYCYALTWLMIPLFFVLCLFLGWKWIPKSKTTLVFVVILGVMALPLFLFLAVNFDLIPEIKTAFFSVPKLTGFRGGELATTNIKDGIRDFIRIVLLNQRDNSVVFDVPTTGVYYYFIAPFVVLGVIYHTVRLIKGFKNGKNDLSFVFLAWLISAAVISIVNQNLTIIHINMVHIPVILYGAYGMYGLAELLKSKAIPCLCACFYLISLLVFGDFYLSDSFADFRSEEHYTVLEMAKEVAGEDGIVTFFGGSLYKFPNLLWQEKHNIRDYAENAVYNDDLFFAELLEYKNYRYLENTATMEDVATEGVYIIPKNKTGEFLKLGFEVNYVTDSLAVVSMPIPTK